MEAPNNNHPHKHFSPVSFLAGLLIALVVFFAIYKLVSRSPSSEKTSVVKDSTAVAGQKNEEPKKEIVDFTEEHFYKEHHHRHIDRDAETIIVSPNEISALEKGNLSAKQKRLLDLLPNSPVIYILDLKITDYQNLYFNMGEPLVLENKVLAGQMLHDALKDLSQRKFDACFEKMTFLSFENANDVNALFYGGLAAYFKKDYTQAAVRFDKVIAATNNTFLQEAKWFKAMVLLEENKKEEAKNLLVEIRDTNGFYATRAKEKLTQI